MTTRTWKVYGYEGRQRASFSSSAKYDWSSEGKTRIVEILNSDKTGTNDYSIIRITRDTADECFMELNGQLSDGIFENCRVGAITEITDEQGESDMIKLYGVDVNKDELVSAIEAAERESYTIPNFGVMVVLDTETGKLYQTDRPHGDNSVSERIWKGVDKILYTASQYGWSPFRDWFTNGCTDDELINDFVKDAIGEEAWNAVLLKAEEWEEKPWEVAYEDYYRDIDDAVVAEYTDTWMQDFDTYYHIEQIIEEEKYSRY